MFGVAVVCSPHNDYSDKLERYRVMKHSDIHVALVLLKPVPSGPESPWSVVFCADFATTSPRPQFVLV